MKRFFRAYVMVALGAVCATAQAQSVVNLLPVPDTSVPAEQQAPAPIPLSEYDPFTPPAINVPTIVSPNQDEIAAALAILPGETNEQYTERMRVRYDAAMKALDRVSAEHRLQMKALALPSRR